MIERNNEIHALCMTVMELGKPVSSSIVVTLLYFGTQNKAFTHL